jgi:hypothetical protein
MATEAVVKQKEKIRIIIVHNGVPFEMEAAENASMQSVFSRAMDHFGTNGQPDYALFSEQNVEINLGQSVRDAGVADDQRLVLRPRVTRSGARS